MYNIIEWLILLFQILPNSTGLIEYRAHPFWMQKYCPSHERDGTPRCCSCERMEVSHISSQNISSCCYQKQDNDGSPIYPLRCFCLLHFRFHFLTWNFPISAVKGHKVSFAWWWSKAVSRVSRLRYYGYPWMSTSLSWDTRILWRFKYENRAANSNAFSWETSTEWGHGRRKECKC